MNMLRSVPALALVSLACVAGGCALWSLIGQPQSADDTAYAFGATVSRTASSALIVDSLRDGGEAERAGLRVGDSIEQVDHHLPRSRLQIEQALAAHHQVLLHIRRTGQVLDVQVLDRS